MMMMDETRRASPSLLSQLISHLKGYEELLDAVASKHPGESRHETALRYIRERENRIALAAAAKSEAEGDAKP